MPPRQRLEIRQREAAPILQNQDVTTAAIILNNVLGAPLPQLALNLATPKDQPIPMGHDCTRCAATATCSLLNKAAENEGNNPIMDRINAINLIKNEDPEFIQRATPEDRESLIRAKMMEIKEQRSNVVIEKPQIETVAQEVKVEIVPIQEAPKKNETETVIEDTPPAIRIEKPIEYKSHMTQEIPNILAEQYRQKNILIEKTNIFDTGKTNLSLSEKDFDKKSKLPSMIEIPNIFFDKDQPSQLKNDGHKLNSSKGEIFKYSPNPTVDIFKKDTKILKKTIYISKQSHDFNTVNRLPLKPRVSNRINPFFLISLKVIDSNLLYKSNDKLNRVKNIENKQKKNVPKKGKEKTSKVEKYIHLLNKDNINKGSGLGQMIRSEKPRKKEMNILIEKIRQVILKEKKPPFAVTITSTTHNKEKHNNKRPFDQEKNIKQYEILPISQTEFLNIVNLSSLIKDVMSLLSGKKTPVTDEETYFIEYSRLLQAPEEIQNDLKNQAGNISIIIWFIVQVLMCINLLDMFLAVENLNDQYS